MKNYIRKRMTYKTLQRLLNLETKIEFVGITIDKDYNICVKIELFNNTQLEYSFKEFTELTGIKEYFTTGYNTIYYRLGWWDILKTGYKSEYYIEWYEEENNVSE